MPVNNLPTIYKACELETRKGIQSTRKLDNEEGNLICAIMIATVKKQKMK